MFTLIQRIGARLQFQMCIGCSVLKDRAKTHIVLAGFAARSLVCSLKCVSKHGTYQIDIPSASGPTMIDIVRSHSNDVRPRTLPGYQLDARDFRQLLATPPIDRDLLLVQCLNNVDFAMNLLDQFQKTSQFRLDVFDAALQAKDHVKIANAAHGLKGVAGILAANALMEVCTNLISSVEADDWNEIRDLIRQLHREMSRMIDYIPRVAKL